MAKQTKSTKSAKVAKKSGSNSDSFVPEDVMGAGESAFLNLKNSDEVKFRIISMPVIGWVAWDEDEEGNKKPTRTAIDDQPDMDAYDEDNQPRKFMALIVIDRNDEDKKKVLELTQQSIIKAINALSSNPDWGKPFSYDINVVKKGEGLKTRYTVTPSPKKPLAKNVIRDAQEKPCNLDNYFEDKSPWECEDGDETELFFK